MKDFVKSVITTAATTAGMAPEAVIDKPKKEGVGLPARRIQIDYSLPEGLKRSFRRVARLPSTGNPGTHRVIRSQVYKRDFPVRVDIRSDDELWLAGFVELFLVALPGKVADPNNNLVTIEAHKAVRGGFETKIVEVFKKKSMVLHINFKGMICRDEEIPLIKKVDLVSGASYRQFGKE